MALAGCSHAATGTSASGYSDAFGNDVMAWVRANEREDTPSVDLAAGAIADDLSGLGAPQPFLDWLVFEKLTK